LFGCSVPERVGNMNHRISRPAIWGVVGVLILLSVALGGVSQYAAVRLLQAGIGKHAYGKPFGAGTREFRPQGVYVGQVVALKTYALPTEEMDVPGLQSRYLIRRRTADGEVYEAYYATDLLDLLDVPPAEPIIGAFPPLGYLDVVHKNE